MSTTICPYCKDSVSDQDAVLCPSCEAAHHPECWDDNGGICSVFGCDSKPEAGVLGCPWCGEVYIHRNVLHCLRCGSPLMTPREYRGVVEAVDWTPLELEAGSNPELVAGFLRNSQVSVRLERRPGVSMVLQGSAVVFVAQEDEAVARRLLRELKEQFVPCDRCGHILTRGEECTYCVESGAQA